PFPEPAGPGDRARAPWEHRAAAPTAPAPAAAGAPHTTTGAPAETTTWARPEGAPNARPPPRLRPALPKSRRNFHAAGRPSLRRTRHRPPGAPAPPGAA